MNLLEAKMLETLKDLKTNHHVFSVKAEFETEGTRLEEALRLKEIVTMAGLDLTIKIGGCEAIKDMYDAKIIGAATIVAPMIESPYAMKKYVRATELVFSEEERKNMKFLINIETITGFNNLDDIVSSPYFSKISGVVLGRADLAGSMDLSKECVNSDAIFNIANTISKKMLGINKDMIIGGGVSSQSLPFFRKLQYLSGYETRKIIFDAKSTLSDDNAEQGILKAIGFELMWLKNKREFYGMIFKEDEQRFKMLEECYEQIKKESDGVYA